FAQQRVRARGDGMSEVKDLPIADLRLPNERQAVDDSSNANRRSPGTPGGQTQIANPLPGLWAQVREDYVAHGRDWTRPGFRAVAVHRLGVWRMAIRSRLLRAPFSMIYRVMYRRVRNVYGIELPYTVQLGRRVVFEHQS